MRNRQDAAAESVEEPFHRAAPRYPRRRRVYAASGRASARSSASTPARQDAAVAARRPGSIRLGRVRSAKNFRRTAGRRMCPFQVISPPLLEEKAALHPTVPRALRLGASDQAAM